MNNSIKESLKLLLNKEVVSNQEAVQSLQDFLRSKGMNEYEGLTDIKILTEIACVFSTLPKASIITKDFLKAFKETTYIDLLDEEIVAWEKRYVNEDGKIKIGGKYREKIILYPKANDEDKKHFKPILEELKKYPHLKSAWVKRGLTIIKGFNSAMIFENVFIQNEMVVGISIFYHAKSEEDLRFQFPQDFLQNKSIAFIKRYNTYSIRPVSVGDIVEMLKFI